MAGRLGSGAGRRPGLGFHWVRSQWDWGDCREWGWGGVQVTAGRLVCRVQGTWSQQMSGSFSSSPVPTGKMVSPNRSPSENKASSVDSHRDTNTESWFCGQGKGWEDERKPDVARITEAWAGTERAGGDLETGLPCKTERGRPARGRPARGRPSWAPREVTGFRPPLLSFLHFQSSPVLRERGPHLQMSWHARGDHVLTPVIVSAGKEKL